MSPLEVVFQVPQWIEAGLRTGEFQRVGGVIVESSSKQVVAWLRDGNLIAQAANLGSKIPNPMGVIIEAAKAALTLNDGRMTRQAIQGVQESVSGLQNTVDFLAGQSMAISTLTAFTATGQVINLALATASFRTTIQRLDRLSNEIEKLGQLIQQEFKRDRDLRFRSALQEARDVFDGSNPATRHQAATSAIKGLYEARENFRMDFDKTLEKSSMRFDDQVLELAYHYLVRAMYAEISRIRCYLETDEIDLARQRLKEVIPTFEKAVYDLIKLWLGDTPSIFLHPSIPTEVVDRFLRLQMWLKSLEIDDEKADAARLMFAVIDDLRQGFWDMSIVGQEPFMNPLRVIQQRLSGNEMNEKVIKLTNNLKRVELVIENYQRLVGFQLEISTMRLSEEFSFRDWRNLVDDDDLQQHLMGIVVNTEVAHQYSSQM